MLPSFKKSAETDYANGSQQGASRGASPGFGVKPASLGMRAATGPSVISGDLCVVGNLTSKGEIQIDGEVQGDVQATHVVIGERARVTGSVVAEEVVVRGHVMGSVRGKRVMLQSTCRVEGDVYHQALSIEQGAYFEGKSRRCDDPTAEIQPRRNASEPAAVTPAPVLRPASVPAA